MANFDFNNRSIAQLPLPQLDTLSAPSRASFSESIFMIKVARAAGELGQNAMLVYALSQGMSLSRLTEILDWLDNGK